MLKKYFIFKGAQTFFSFDQFSRFWYWSKEGHYMEYNPLSPPTPATPPQI